LRKIGIVASNSTEMDAAVILNEGEEKNVKAEDLVLIRNRNGNLVLAVCRGGLGSNENLRTVAYSPGVAYARMGRHPSNAKEFYAFGLSIIGDVTKGLEQSKYVIAPSSDVEVFEESDNPMSYLETGPEEEKGRHTIGYYKDMKPWKVPYDPEYIPYHIGVFGVTGSGKSFLARYQLIPVFRQSGMDVIVFDWKGSDYAPFYHEDQVVKLKGVYLDEDVVYQYMLSRMDYFGFTGERKYKNDAAEALEEVIMEGEWRNKSPSEMKQFLEAKAVPIIEEANRDRTGGLTVYGKMYVRKFKRGIKKLQDRDFENILGKKMHEDVERLGVRDVDVILRNVRSEIEAAIRGNLGCEADIVLVTERLYLRSDYPAPPFCIEVKSGTDVSKILPYLIATHNSATGLPLPLDMIDQNVGLPRGFTREFVEEIEANLVRDSELDKFDLQNHFARLNPQKEE